MNFIKKINYKIESNKNINIIKNSAYFDKDFYISEYKDVALSGIDPAVHYYHFGWKEGRNPNYIFRSHEYLDLHPDVKAQNMCPLLHYIKYGKYEQREYRKNIDFVVYKNTKILNKKNIKCEINKLRICIFLHIYPTINSNTIKKYLENIPKEIDIYILTDTDEKIGILKNSIKNFNIENTIFFKKIKNIGRDTTALLIGCNKIVRNYDLFCFLHYKLSKQNDFGDLWRKYLFDNLIGSKECIYQLINEFINNKKLGIVFPPVFPWFLNADHWDISNNKIKCERILKNKFNFEYSITVKDKFPLGGMFWARTSAVIDIFDANYNYDDFKDDNKIDGTLRHHIERLWGIISQKNGYSIEEVFMRRDNKINNNYNNRNRIAIYQCRKFTNTEKFSAECLFSIAKVVIIVINNEKILENKLITNNKFKIILRKNTGMDFSAWRDAFLSIGDDILESYDEVILCNDSCFFPITNINEMFGYMDNINCDFWGNTIHPEKEKFREHIQSYFYVFKKNVVKSFAFKKFFYGCKNIDKLDDLIMEYENNLTYILKCNHFKYACYLPLHTAPLKNFHIYAYPLAYFLVGNIFLKKKSLNFIEHKYEDLLYFIKNVANMDIKKQILEDIKQKTNIKHAFNI